MERKVVESYFGILTDLMIAHQLPVFARQAKRRLASHPEFYFFDVKAEAKLTGALRCARGHLFTPPDGSEYGSPCTGPLSNTSERKT